MYHRRSVLALGGTALATALAGCTDDGQDGSDGGSDGGDGGSDGGDGGSDGGDGATATPTATSTDTGAGDQKITVGPDGSLRFDPAQVTVSTGTTVEWVWDSDFHSVTPDSQPDGVDWEGTGTETFDEGHTHSFTFETAGTYEYYCNPHRSQGMTGSITVE